MGRGRSSWAFPASKCQREAITIEENKDIKHYLESVHVSQGVGSLRERTHALLALTGRVVPARSRLSAAAASGVDVRSI